jgi:hypothetical protein
LQRGQWREGQRGAQDGRKGLNRLLGHLGQEGLRHISFGDGAMAGVRISTPAQLAAQQLFFDMRHVSRAFEQLGGESEH